MCLIIHKEKDINVPYDLLEDAFYRNSDGWGIMYYNDVEKCPYFVKGKALSTLWSEVQKRQHLEIVIHMRFMTHGAVCESNTHPFILGNSGILMMHNGIIPNMEVHEVKSDTFLFAELLASSLNADSQYFFKNDNYIKEIVEIGGNSRFCFMLSNGEIIKCGNYAWTEWKGLHLSNTYAWSLHSPHYSYYKGKSYSYTDVGYGEEEVQTDLLDDSRFYPLSTSKGKEKMMWCQPNNLPQVEQLNRKISRQQRRQAKKQQRNRNRIGV